MENHATVVKGTTVQRSYDSAGNLTGQATINTRNRSLDTVSRYSLVQGDKKKPTAFSYTALARSAYIGLDQQFTSGKLVSSEDGVLTGSDLYARSNPSFPDLRSFHYNKALSDINDKVRGQLDLAVDVSEWKQTRDMIKKMDSVEGAFDELGRLIGGATRKGIGKRELAEILFKRQLKALGGIWLTWQYGVRPLLGTIHDLGKELVQTRIPEILQVSEKSYSAVEAIKLSQLYAGDPLETAKVNGINGCYISMRFQEPANAWDAARYSSLNPASLAWELLPLSFVVDWIYDIGGMLRNLETAILYGSRFVDGYYTTLRALQGNHLSDLRMASSGGGTSFIKRRAFSEMKLVEFDRVRLVSYPGPRLPTFRVNLGAERMLSLAALGTLVLNGGSKRS